MIQSPARDIFASGFIEAHKRGLGDHLRLVVHDEIDASFPRGPRGEEMAHELEDAMTTVFKGIPIITEAQNLGERWKK
jgi:hypothetical protein